MPPRLTRLFAKLGRLRPRANPATRLGLSVLSLVVISLGLAAISLIAAALINGPTRYVMVFQGLSLLGSALLVVLHSTKARVQPQDSPILSPPFKGVGAPSSKPLSNVVNGAIDKSVFAFIGMSAAALVFSIVVPTLLFTGLSLAATASVLSLYLAFFQPLAKNQAVGASSLVSSASVSSFFSSLLAEQRRAYGAPLPAQEEPSPLDSQVFKSTPSDFHPESNKNDQAIAKKNEEFLSFLSGILGGLGVASLTISFISTSPLSAFFLCSGLSFSAMSVVLLIVSAASKYQTARAKRPPLWSSAEQPSIPATENYGQKGASVSSAAAHPRKVVASILGVAAALGIIGVSWLFPVSLQLIFLFFTIVIAVDRAPIAAIYLFDYSRRSAHPFPGPPAVRVNQQTSQGTVNKRLDRLDWASFCNRFGGQATFDCRTIFSQWDKLPVSLANEFTPWMGDVVTTLEQAMAASFSRYPRAMRAWLRGCEERRYALTQSEETLQQVVSLAAKFPAVRGLVSAWLEAAVFSPQASVLGFQCPSIQELEAIAHRCEDERFLQEQENLLRAHLRSSISNSPVIFPCSDSLGETVAPCAVGHQSRSVEVANPKDIILPLPSSLYQSQPPTGSVDRRTVVVLK